MEEIKDLIELLKLEEKAQKEFYIAHLENDSVKKRVSKGISIYPLNIKKKSFGIGSYPFIEANHFQNDLRLFKPGSPIVLFSNEADQTVKGQLHYSNNEAIGISLYLDDFPDWINDGKIGLNASFDASTFDITKEVLTRLTEGKNKEITPLINYFYKKESVDLNFNNSQIGNLNLSQSKAVQAINSEELVSVIHGPPGTGKTTVLTAAIQEASQHKKRVLACAPSNAAVDNLSEKLLSKGLKVLRIGNPSKVSEHLLAATMDEQIKNHPQFKLTKTLQKQADDFRKMSRQYKRKFGKEEREQRNALRKEVKKLQFVIKQITKHIRQTIWEEAEVICGTIMGAYKSWNQEDYFDMVVLDEAGQALPTDTWVCASMGKKLIMAGDPFQLPPTIFSKEAEKKGLNISLIERWISKNKPNHLLNVQYRMNDLIASFSNEYFYNNQVTSDQSNANHVLKNNDFSPVEFIDTAGCDYEEEDLEIGSKTNKGEADLIKKLIQSFDHEELAIISPYRGQVHLLQQQLTGINKKDINTIDSFQGQERDVIIVSLVRSNSDQKIGFLKDYRRMNVAMTRARKKMILIGDSATIGADTFYGQFLDFVEKNASYRSAWEFID